MCYDYKHGRSFRIWGLDWDELQGVSEFSFLELAQASGLGQHGAARSSQPKTTRTTLFVIVGEPNLRWEVVHRCYEPHTHRIYGAVEGLLRPARGLSKLRA